MVNKKPIFSIYGVRGSIAAPKSEFMGFGGNTSSYTLRTPSNTMIFLDAGTGIQYATDELKDVADKVMLAISHVHADHTMGLGMSQLPWLCFNPNYKNKKVKIIGPNGVESGFRQYYDGKRNWPVHFSNSSDEKPNMPGIDIGGIEKLIDENKIYLIDDSTKFKIMKGNHPVEGGVVLYRFEIQEVAGGLKALVYATDNEFDFFNMAIPNKNAKALKDKYVEFISNANLLVADAQYTKEEYVDKIPMDVHGFGHSFTEQILDLANRGKVKQVMITHHGKHDDTKLAQRESAAKQYAKEQGYHFEVLFAKENMKHVL